MRRVSPLISIAVTMAAVSFPVGAQTPPVAIPAKDFGPVWTGFYVGAAFGAGGTFNRLDVGGPALNTNVHGSGQSGVLGSIYGGVDYQITQRGLVGLLAEASYAGFNGSVSASVPGAFAQVNQNTGFGWAVLLRAGFLADPSTLLYFTGGYAGQIISTNGTATVPGGTASFSTNNTMNGWTFGPGFETMLTKNLSAKLEYRYSQFGRQTIGSTGISMEPSTHAIRAGLSYRFGGLGVVSSDQSFAGSSQPFNWTGVYLGGAIGGGLGFAQTNTFAGTASTSFNSGSQGLLGGFFAGGDWQFSPQALVGVMADYTFQGITGGINLTTPGGSAYATAEQNRQWSVMGRLGWLPVPSTLLYAAGGYSQLNVHASAGASFGGVAPFAQRDTSFSGFTVGPGIETAVTGGWTTRLEYRFSQFEQKEVMSGMTYQPSNHTIRAGISYKFGFGGKTMTAEAAD
jgi:outer membrane immunogenic protein